MIGVLDVSLKAGVCSTMLLDVLSRNVMRNIPSASMSRRGKFAQQPDMFAIQLLFQSNAVLAGSAAETIRALMPAQTCAATLILAAAFGTSQTEYARRLMLGRGRCAITRRWPGHVIWKDIAAPAPTSVFTPPAKIFDLLEPSGFLDFGFLSRGPSSIVAGAVII